MAEPDAEARLAQALEAMQRLRARLEAAPSAGHAPIAVIGMGCRFPGGVDSPEAFWCLLQDGVDATGDVPAGRWDVAATYDPDPEAPGKMYVRRGGFLDPVDRFDPHFFGIAPREVEQMDPQQRLLLEVAWEALEHAAQAPDRLVGTRTGVFVGITASDYLQLHARYQEPEAITAYLGSGNALNVAAGRVAFLLGVHGPSLAVDTACSSSLMAVHLACQSLRRGESDLALAGGVNLTLVPESFIAFCKWGMLSPDGRCKTFDARADGMARGEGCGVVVLKRLADAEAHGDRILAVVRGSAANHDGPSSGLSVPNGLAQEAVIRRALAEAEMEPGRIGFVETHGTGTALGDPIEVDALAAVLGQSSVEAPVCHLGAVKTNIAHLEAAAGIAGLIKTVLVLQHGTIPPNCHFERPNPRFTLDGTRLAIPATLQPWPAGARPRVAGVSAFGFSGTNVHVVVEEAAPAAAPADGIDRPRHLLALSAKTAPALAELAERHLAELSARPDRSLADACFSANAGRAHFDYRLAIPAGSVQELRTRLAEPTDGRAAPRGPHPTPGGSRRPKVAFLFTGQGSQHVGMGQTLYETQPTFRRALDHCAALLAPHLDVPLLDLLYPPTWRTNPRSEIQNPKLHSTHYTQPALFALEYALATLWQSWGIVPDAVLGHSAGEVVAACLAGVFDLESGLRLIVERGRLIQSLAPGDGAMVAVLADEATLRPALAGWADRVAIAAHNGPENTVISGGRAAVEAVVEALVARGIKVRPLAVSHAFHSPQMEPVLAPLAEAAAGVPAAPPQLPFVSNLYGRPFGAREAPDATYWCRHLREPVQFAAGMAALGELGIDTFIEVGPNPTLLGMGRRCLPGDAAAWLPSLRQGRDDWVQLLDSLAELYMRGAAVDWQGFDADYHRARLALPTYPFQRERYWPDLPRERPSRSPGASNAARPLLGTPVRSPLLEAPVYESRLGPAGAAFLADHRVQGRIVVPATAYVELLLEAADALWPGQAARIEDLLLGRPLAMEATGERTVQVALGRLDDRAHTGQVFGLEPVDGETWTVHATARLCRVEDGNAAALSEGGAESLAELAARCPGELPMATFYERFAGRGIDFGPRFRGVVRVWQGQGEALGRIEVPTELAGETAGTCFHPALLDACWQVLLATAPTDDEASDNRVTFLPLHLAAFRVHRRPAGPLWSHARLRGAGAWAGDALTGDVRILDEHGRLVAEATGLVVKRVPAAAVALPEQARWRDWLYTVRWQVAPWPGESEPRPQPAGGAVSLPVPAELARQVMARPADAPAQEEPAAESVDLERRLEAVCTGFVLQALRELGWAGAVGDVVTADGLTAELGVRPRFRPLVGRLLGMLVADGIVEEVADGWRVRRVPAPGDPEADLVQLLAAHPAHRPELGLLARCGPRLAEVLGGRCDPLQLLFPEGSLAALEALYRDSPTAREANGLVAEAVAAAAAGQPPDRPIRILEVGAGTGGTTAHVLARLPGDRAEYTFTDVSPVFLHQARDRFGEYPFVGYGVLDLEGDPLTQSFEAHAFDIVIAANVVHATRDLGESLDHLATLLAPGGLLVLLEGVAARHWVDLTFGLTEGWWRFADHRVRPDYPLLTEPAWLKLLADQGWDEPAAVAGPAGLFPQAILLAHRMAAEPPESAAEADAAGSWLILADAAGVGAALAERLAATGARCVVVRPGGRASPHEDGVRRVDPLVADDYLRLIEAEAAAGAPPWRGVVHLWALDAPAAAEGWSEPAVGEVTRHGCGSALALVQALVRARLPAPPHLWLVTRGAQVTEGGAAEPAAALQAPLWGLGKVIALEHPELHVRCIDLDPEGEAGVAEAEALRRAISWPDAEDQLALRGTKRQVARLERWSVAEALPADGPLDWQDERRPLRWEVGVPGDLNTLEARPRARRRPGPGEVEIRVQATGLNFRDVLNALGLYPGDAGLLGGECAGRIVAVGPGVAGLQVGDAVMAVAAGCLGHFVTTAAELVVPMPAGLDFEEATTIPVATMTAHYGLAHCAHLAAGERVLIHAAAGGVGLAAVRLAQRIGAEVWATAGSPRKRAFLRSIGVAHVMDSRTPDFGTLVLDQTGGRGVDVVLSSLGGELIAASVTALAEDGRFVELGKRDIWSPEAVARVKPRASYHVVDLAATAAEDPGRIRALLQEVTALVAGGASGPLPRQVFAMADVGPAFRFMAQARHIGKVVVGQQEQPMVRADATYLVTGGLGGLGLLTAERLMAHGARHLVLVGRHEPSALAAEAIGRLEQAGARVLVRQADVSDADQLRRVLDEIDREGPALRGVIHAAGVLADGALVQQDWSRFAQVLAPKVEGTWHLHALTRHRPLDFFVLYSSGSAVLGSAGQGNHAAANAFLDALAQARRALGLPALSINWGVWSEIGAAAGGDIGARAAGRGIGTIDPAAGLAVLDHLLGATADRSWAVPAQVMAAPVDWGRFRRHRAPGVPAPFFADLEVRAAFAPPPPTAAAAPAPGVQSDLAHRLMEAPPDNRPPLMLAHVRAQARRVLGLGPAQPLDDRQPLSELGLDSLMAVELRNVLGADLALARSLPATLVFDYPSVASLADCLLEELFGAADGAAGPTANGGGESLAVAELATLSEEAAEALLRKELGAGR
jgi:acyl transferase domain-containing protein/NADPH:quinone reductase-like Zn-dependent oxidoreductase